jgi:ligand-binding sensor domain-containing protein
VIVFVNNLKEVFFWFLQSNFNLIICPSQLFVLRKIIIVILSFVPLTFIRAQWPDEKNFAFYSAKDGLSSNQVTGILQDAYGYIWIGTRKGLNRFDGNSFLQFYSDSSQNSLPSDWIFKLKWLDKDNLAACTNTGLHIINTRTLQSRNIIIPPGFLKYRYKVNFIQDMTSNEEGDMFILTGSGFYHYNNKDELLFRYDHFKKEDVESQPFQFGRNIIRVEKNVVLLSTIDGLFIYNIAKKDLHAPGAGDDIFYHHIAEPKERFFFIHSDGNSFMVQKEGGIELSVHNAATRSKQIISSQFVTSGKFNWKSMVSRLNDTLYAINGREKGFYLIKFDPVKRSYELQSQLYFENFFCSCMLIDKSNRLWIGTNKGLFKQKRPAGSLEKLTVPVAMNPFNKDLQIRMLTIANDRIFVTTFGQGLLVFDRPGMNPLKQIDFLSYWSAADNVFNTITVNDDTVMAGCYGALIAVNTKNFNHRKIDLPEWDIGHDWVSSLFKDSRNNIYVSRPNNNEFYYRDANDKKFVKVTNDYNTLSNITYPEFITEDRDGNIWFSGHGICRFNYQLKKFDMLMDSFPSVKTPRKEAWSLTFDQKGKMYFGLPGNGLIIYDPAQKKYQQLTRSDGLPDNNIRAIYFYKNKLWLGTESGLASYDVTTKKISSFGIADDIPADPFTAYSFYFDTLHRQLYGAFNNTIIRFDPDKLTKNNSPPDFFIENIAVSDNETISHPDDKIELSYKHNNIVINLAAVNFEDAYQQQFAYRFVKNGNEPWQETGSQRSIIFSNLSPGDHHLQLKVFTKNNSWPEQIKEINIVIKPPFWQTTWFILLAVVLIAAALYALYRYRIKAVHQKANIDKQLAELEIKGLHAQMNPHFIFNSLNSIKEMILEDEKQNASRYLSKFAQLIRTNLDQSRQTFITVKQCIDHLQQYLEMEKIRFEQFNYTIDVEEDLPEDIRMSPMLIQPLAENAIWHGLRNKTGEKELNIRFYKLKNQLICEIEDNGIGIHQSMKDKTGLQSTHRSLGIASINERLKIFNEKYNMNSSLQIIDKSELPGKNGSGTLAILRFNI